MQVVYAHTVDFQISWMCTSGAGFHWWSSACCDCTGPLMSYRLCWSSCICRLRPAWLLPGCSIAVLSFLLQCPVVWPRHPWGRSQAPASIGSGCWWALHSSWRQCQGPLCSTCRCFWSREEDIKVLFCWKPTRCIEGPWGPFCLSCGALARANGFGSVWIGQTCCRSWCKWGAQCLGHGHSTWCPECVTGCACGMCWVFSCLVQRVLQDTTHLIERPCYQQGSSCQDPAGNWTTWRPPDCHKKMQSGAVWSCLLFIRSGQNHLTRHGERGKKTRQTEEQVGRQHQGMDRPGVCQVPEGSGEQGKMEENGWKSSVVPKQTSWLRDRWWWWCRGSKTHCLQKCDEDASTVHCHLGVGSNLTVLQHSLHQSSKGGRRSTDSSVDLSTASRERLSVTVDPRYVNWCTTSSSQCSHHSSKTHHRGCGRPVSGQMWHFMAFLSSELTDHNLMMGHSSQTRILGKVDGQFLHTH